MINNNKISDQIDKDQDGGVYSSMGFPFGAMSPVNLTSMGPMSPMSAFSPIGTATSPMLSPVGKDILSQMAPGPFSPFTGTALGPPLPNGTMPYDRPLVPPLTPPGLTVPGMVGPGMVGPGMVGPGMVGPGMIRPGIMGPGVMGPGVMGPGVMGPGVMGPGVMGPGVMGPGVMGPGVMGPGMLHHGMMPSYDKMTVTAVAPGAVAPIVHGTPIVSTVTGSPKGPVTVTGSPEAVKDVTDTLASSHKFPSTSSVKGSPKGSSEGSSKGSPKVSVPVPTTPAYIPPPVYEDVVDGTNKTLGLVGAGVVLIEKYVKNNNGDVEPAILLFKSKDTDHYGHLIGTAVENETPERTAKKHASLSSLNLLVLEYLRLNRKINDTPAFVTSDISSNKIRSYVVVMDNGVLSYQHYLANARIYESTRIKIDGSWTMTNDLKWFSVSEFKKVMNTSGVNCVDAQGVSQKIDDSTRLCIKDIIEGGLLDLQLNYPVHTKMSFDNGSANMFLKGTNVAIISDKTYSNGLGGYGMGGYGMGAYGMGGYGMGGYGMGAYGMGGYGMGGYGMTMM